MIPSDADVLERQRIILDAQARIDELLARVAQPTVSAGSAVRALTDEQRAALISSRDASLQVIEEELGQLRPMLAALEQQARIYQDEFTRAIDSGTMPPKAIADWFENNDEEFGRLKTTIREFEDFRTALVALQAAPLTLNG